VVAEGIKAKKELKQGVSATQALSHKITELTGLETRQTVLGYIQRGGAPSPTDRMLATRYGAAAADLIAERDYGKMVALKNNEITSVQLADIAGKLKLVKQDNPIVIQAQKMGTSFGI